MKAGLPAFSSSKSAPSPLYLPFRYCLSSKKIEPSREWVVRYTPRAFTEITAAGLRRFCTSLPFSSLPKNEGKRHLLYFDTKVQKIRESNEWG